MSVFGFDIEKNWEYENGFYLTSDVKRIPKLLAHYEIYKMIVDLPGHIAEFGVYKGVSLIQWLTFRDILESKHSRTVYGFDIFGKFPKEVSLKKDKDFIEKFENYGGDGIPAKDLEYYLQKKGFENYELIEGDILETIPDFINQNPQIRFSLIHIDVDVYEPTKAILEYLLSRLVKGGIIVLDDYGTVLGETQAIEEEKLLKDFKIRKLPISHIPSYIIKK